MKPTSSREPEPGESIKDFGITVIATEGSRWELWETEHRYRRSPLTETSRENPAWGGPEAGPLQDHVWHEFTHWEITAYPFGARLVIDLPDGSRIRGPHPNRAIGTRHACVRCTPATVPDPTDDPSVALLDQPDEGTGDDL